jgi:hypothetical protein
MFSAVPTASCPVFTFCAPKLVFGGTEGVVLFSHITISNTFSAIRGGGVKSRFLILRARINFRRFRGRRVPFSCFTRPDSFSAPGASGLIFLFFTSDSFSEVPGASGPFFMFCATGHVFGGTRSVGSRFSCFVRLDSFSVVPGASGLVFMFCAPGLIFVGTEGVGSHVLVFASLTRFRRYQGHRVSFSRFVLPDSFSAVLGASGLVFLFCALKLIFGGFRGFGSRIHVLRTQTRFRWYRGHRDPFSYLAPGLILGHTEGVVSRFHVMRSRTYFRRYRGRRVPFSCFAPPDSFSAVPGASGPFFIFCAPGLVFGGTWGVASRYHVLGARTHFRWYRGRQILFS